MERKIAIIKNNKVKDIGLGIGIGVALGIIGITIANKKRKSKVIYES